MATRTTRTGQTCTSEFVSVCRVIGIYICYLVDYHYLARGWFTCYYTHYGDCTCIHVCVESEACFQSCDCMHRINLALKVTCKVCLVSCLHLGCAGDVVSLSLAFFAYKKTDISYQKTSRVFLHKSSNWRLCSATGQSKLSAAVERISLARQSHHVQLPAKMLTQQFHSALPVNDQNLPKQNYHGYLPLFCHLGNTKLI